MRKILLPLSLLSLLIFFFVSSHALGVTSREAQGSEPQAHENETRTETSRAGNVVEKKGIRVEFSIQPESGGASEPQTLRQGGYADVRFRITDAATGTPISPLEPAVWISRLGEGDGDITCRDRISRYTQGMLGYQADIDLNKYFILIMNNDQTISVVDPLLGVNGITQLFAMIILKDRGEDWVPSHDGKLLFVSMPKADSVAVVNLENFKVIKNISSGNNPVRVTLQPDGKYLWVGNDGKSEDTGGVTVIDTRSYSVAAYIPTGKGYHDIAFSDDSLLAFVTNSMAGTLSVIDTQNLEKIKDLPTGKKPIAVQFSTLSQAAYVAAEGDGAITVVDRASLEATRVIQTEPGLVALRFEPKARWGFAANINNNRVYIIDSSKAAIAHTLEVGYQPHQFGFSDTYAYVRHLGTPELKLIPLAQLGKNNAIGSQTVVMGSRNPGIYPYHAMAPSISPTGEWAAVVAANPADKMVYYYMEGMLGPMGSYQSYGRVPRAVGVVDRSLRESGEKGVYSAKIRIPEAGTYNVAFIIDSPLIDQCFTFTALPDTKIKAGKEQQSVRLEFLDKERAIPLYEPFRVRFSLTRASNGEPLSGLRDVVVLSTRMPGSRQQRQLAKSIGEGRYEVSLMAEQPGVYLISIGIPSLQVDMSELPYRSFRVEKGDKS